MNKYADFEFRIIHFEYEYLLFLFPKICKQNIKN